MLHEEEFFDAIDATLDKMEKEDERVGDANYMCMFLWLSGTRMDLASWRP